MGNSVVHLKIITGLEERTFAVQKARLLENNSNLQHKDKKVLSFDYFASYLQASEISYFINFRGKIVFTLKFSHCT